MSTIKATLRVMELAFSNLRRVVQKGVDKTTQKKSTLRVLQIDLDIHIAAKRPISVG
ncbi:MAG TPA: hypothetical protein VLA93_21090 [Pyrinomonadaceae bacterium]|nr:hypothetical protein [Pyrinomonadaceae bacterium]